MNQLKSPTKKAAQARTAQCLVQQRAYYNFHPGLSSSQKNFLPRMRRVPVKPANLTARIRR